MAFYQALQRRGARLVAVTSEGLDANRMFLGAHGVTPDTVIAAQANGLAFRGTPTLVLVDAGGTVRGCWADKQDGQGELDVLRRIE